MFDFGCGTGGELIGFITAVSEQLPSVKHIDIRALDGNVHALRMLECILENISQRFEISFDSHLMPIVIDDFYDMGIVTDIITQLFDFVISFKAICEFVTRQQFDEQNPYEHIINVFSPKLKSNGTSNPQPIGFSGILLAKRQNSFYCTYFLHNRNVADTKSPYPIKRLEVIRWFNQKSMVFNQSLS